MHFTIITPSFNQLDYLRRCVTSVGDQIAPKAQRSESPITVQHHIQDGSSTDGTVDWMRNSVDVIAPIESNLPPSRNQQTSDEVVVLKRNKLASTNIYQLTFASEADSGMYDALNRGIQRMLDSQRTDDGRLRAEGGGQTLSPNNDSLVTTNNCDDSIIAWLNCDEQYLPGTLKKVADYFEAHPEVDFVYGNTLLLDSDGALISCRKNPPLRKCYVESDHLYTQSASMFFREKIFRKGMRFNTKWKAVSDCDFVLTLLSQGFRPGRMNDYLSTFTMTGENLSAESIGWTELKHWRRQQPGFIRLLSPVLRGLRYFEKIMMGCYRQTFPLDYEIYAADEADHRTCVHAESGTTRFVSWTR